MKKQSHSRSSLKTAACLVIFVVLSAGSSFAAIRGILIKTSGVRVPERGSAAIRYLPSQKQYLINVGGVGLKIPRSQVREVRTAKPKQFDAAARAVMSGSPASAIPVLERIMTAYRMLQWDLPAAEYLVRAYLKMNQPKKAIENAEKVFRVNPSAMYSGDLAKLYWKALNDVGRRGKLRRILVEAVERGSRDVAATAQIMRGDIDFKRGNYRDALVDGYLRTVVLFRDIKKIQPEALYKAMTAHEKLGEHSHAEKWRKKLLSEFPDSSYSRRLRG